jgi:NitT/TauT family transport system ATP-binding protein
MITVEGVCKRFWHGKGKRWVTALDNASLHVAAEEIVCVLGPSGCGKSTLLNLIAGFERPCAGRVLFNRTEVSGPGPDRGVVFQDHNLFPWLTAQQNVEFGLRNLGVSQEERHRRAEHYLRMVGLAEFADARPHTLSGGMKQRVALARTLVMSPQALLMDEPFGALDPISRDRLQDELLRILEQDRRARMSVLFITHNVAEAVFLADRVVLMGPPPQSTRKEITITLPQPRVRTSSAMNRLLGDLNHELGMMPCCVSPNGRLVELSGATGE